MVYPLLGDPFLFRPSDSRHTACDMVYPLLVGSIIVLAIWFPPHSTQYSLASSWGIHSCSGHLIPTTQHVTWSTFFLGIHSCSGHLIPATQHVTWSTLFLWDPLLSLPSDSHHKVHNTVHPLFGGSTIVPAIWFPPHSTQHGPPSSWVIHSGTSHLTLPPITYLPDITILRNKTRRMDWAQKMHLADNLMATVLRWIQPTSLVGDATGFKTLGSLSTFAAHKIRHHSGSLSQS